MARPTSRVCGVLMTGSLVSFEGAYREELRRRGYTVRSAVCEVRQVARLSCWLAERGGTAAELSGVRVDEFLAWQRAEGRYRSHRSRPGLMCLLDVLREQGVLAARDPAVPSSATDGLLAGFVRYLVTERGVTAGTVALWEA